ncbi:hypothetical protein [Nocardioides solisilvae]|uniref:hypothetical protein n=1 Tax=Nocardioides solisilvae TaxID=1542435 RepID=UPI000D740A5F|nr:hypothetical protein [Nocardioides solisilvae]
METHGRPVAYGYLDRAYPLHAYQTVFSTRPGVVQRAYDEAVAGGYLWHEFGDSALLLPG